MVQSNLIFCFIVLFICLGPTLKLKRPAVVGMYEKTIEAFYSDSADQ